MPRPTVLVTGATGKTGAGLVHELLAKEWPVRALVHKRDARSEALAKKGAEIVVADMFNPDQLYDALKGTQRAYYLPFFHTHMIQSAVAFSLAARESKLEAIVHMGQWLSHRSHPALMTRQTWLVDRLFADIPGIAHITINPGMFADNFLRVVEELTGNPAESFETTARRYAAMPFARPTVGNRLKAVVNFNLTPFYRGYDLDRWEKTAGIPKPPRSSLSIDDLRWREEHQAMMAKHAAFVPGFASPMEGYNEIA